MKGSHRSKVQPHRSGIPTTYRAARFRSRLEAKWAVMFDMLGWKWVYEPFDLNGYIPDFAFVGWKSKLIVEIKPAMSREELHAYAEKVETSGWDGDALMLGASPNLGNFGEVFGIATQRGKSPNKEGEEVQDGWHWGDVVVATGHRNNNSKDPICPHRCLFNESMAWNCYRCGVYCKFNADDDLEAMWNEAGNRVQWNRA